MRTSSSTFHSMPAKPEPHPQAGGPCGHAGHFNGFIEADRLNCSEARNSVGSPLMFW